MNGHGVTHLRAWRDCLGLTRKNVVEKIAKLHPEARGMDQATLHKWEIGTSPIRLSEFYVLAEVYKVDVEMLLRPPPPEVVKIKVRKMALRKFNRWLDVKNPDAAAVERWFKRCDR